MIFIGNPHAVQVAVKQTIAGLPVTTVLNFDFGAVPTAGDIEEFAETVSVAYGEAVVPFKAFNVSTVGFVARSLATPNSPMAEYDYPLPLPGQVAVGVASSASLALVLTLRTGVPGRSFRGRIYEAGPMLGEPGSNYATGGFGNGIRGAYEAFADEMRITEGKPLCVYSRYTGGEPRSTGVLTPVMSISLRNLRLDSQRRRMPSD